MNAKEQRKGKFLRWFHRGQQVDWGTDPGVYDAEAVANTLSVVRRIFGPNGYFGLDIVGWHNVPSAPVLLVSNHSGGTTIPDVWGFLAGWYTHFGVARPVHPLAHEIVMSTATTGAFFSRRGVLRGARGIALHVLQDYQRDVLVFPGGDLDTWRPWTERYKVRFSGRVGYARTALQAQVPIVPVAHAGAHETLIVLSDGRRLAQALGLQHWFRAEIFPIHLSFPWGLAVGPWPHLPPPTKLRYRIGEPIAPTAVVSPGEEPPEEAVRELDRQVRASIQELLDQLRDEAK